MKVIEGKGVFGGVAIGKLRILEQKEQTIKRVHVDNEEDEIKRFEDAKQKAIDQLGNLHEKAIAEVGEASAAIFQIHQMMLEDLDYIESIENIIRTQSVNAEYAIGVTSDNFTQMFSSMEDEYMRERAADVKDVSERLIRVLSNKDDETINSDETYILGASDLAPSETVQLDKDKVLGFITQGGSSNSHTAILARTMNIPAIIGVGDSLTPDMDKKIVGIDGYTGKVYVEPDEKTLDMLNQKKYKADEQKELLQKLRGKENITKDGQKINIYANIGNISDLGAVLKNDAGGVGLFRSEFLYLENNDFPTEEQQFTVYRRVLENMAGKKVVIRTLDIGADKKIDYFNLPEEENPALGYRAIRICLKQVDIFKTQLRALFRASAYGNISIMFPMITSVDEVKQIKDIVNEVKQELREEGIKYSEDIEIGIMIETPAAVMVSDDLAKEVDFFSVGTNDLTQYTLAIDRQNNNLSSFYNPHHKGLLRMLKMIADNAHKNNIWMGICGELGADEELTEFFLSIGVDELSVSPAFILPLRKKVRETDVSQVKKSVLDELI